MAEMYYCTYAYLREDRTPYYISKGDRAYKKSIALRNHLNMVQYEKLVLKSL